MKRLIVIILCMILVSVAVLPVLAQDGDLIECDKIGASSQYYYGLGWGEYNVQRYENAVVYFTCAMQIDQTYSDARHMRGVCYELMGMFAEARDDYARVIELDPTYMISYVGLVNAYVGLENLRSALVIASDIIELFPDVASNYVLRGFVYNRMNAYPYALQDFTTAIELDSNYYLAYYRRAFLYTNAYDDYESAFADIDFYLDFTTTDNSAYFLRGYINTQLGNYEDAIIDYNRAIELGYYDNLRIYRNRGWTYDQMGEYQLALDDYNRVIELGGASVVIFGRRGWVYLELGYYELALNDFITAIDINDRVADFYAGLAISYERLGDIDAAQEAYNDFLDASVPFGVFVSDVFSSSRLTLPENWAEYLNN